MMKVQGTQFDSARHEQAMLALYLVIGALCGVFVGGLAACAAHAFIQYGASVAGPDAGEERVDREDLQATPLKQLLAAGMFVGGGVGAFFSPPNFVICKLW
jgi:hypothetical protein